MDMRRDCFGRLWFPKKYSHRRMLALGAVLSMPLPPAAHADDGGTAPLTFNIGIVSDYVARGLSMTGGQPALQGGFDYVHRSGVYAGAWASNISWVKDFTGSGNIELDLYAGYKSAFDGGKGSYDIGYVAYRFPGHGPSIPGLIANPGSAEIYGGVSYEWLGVKYSYAPTTYYMGWYGGPAFDQPTTGSDYLELNINYGLPDEWALVGHVGRQRIKGWDTAVFAAASYNDWKVGVSKDLGWSVLGVAMTGSTVAGTCDAVAGGTNPYCWASGNFQPGIGPTGNFRNAGASTVAVTLSKVFEFR